VKKPTKISTLIVKKPKYFEKRIDFLFEVLSKTLNKIMSNKIMKGYDSIHTYKNYDLGYEITFRKINGKKHKK